MSFRTIVSIAAIFLSVSAAVAQQPATNNAAASASSALTNPPVFDGLMVDAKGKTVGRFYPGVESQTPYVVRQIKGIWVALPISDFATGFAGPVLLSLVYAYQSGDCTGQAYMFVNQLEPGNAATPALGTVAIVSPAAAPSIYFAGTPASLLTVLAIDEPIRTGDALCLPNIRW